MTRALEMVRLPGVENRMPSQLSGGQQQRIAMARAIVIEPDVLLMDEPLSALDENLREEMRREVDNLQQMLGVTTIFVTHDQREALSMSDKILVMKDGRKQQEGDPESVYNEPANAFVAGFIGSPAMNFLNARLSPNGESVEISGNVKLPLANSSSSEHAGKERLVKMIEKLKNIVTSSEFKFRMRDTNSALVKQLASYGPVIGRRFATHRGHLLNELFSGRVNS